MKTIKCEICGGSRTYEPLILDGKERFAPRLCDSCIEIEVERATEAKAALKIASQEVAWRAICPPAYQETNPNFPMMDQAFLSGLLRYKPNGRGVGLHGDTGLRKTRMMFLLASQLHFAGHDVFYCSSKRIAGCFATRYGKERASDEARAIIRRCWRAEILFLDDIGKQKFSIDGESEFFDLVEHRTSHLMPILWTANASGDELARMMSVDKGSPIVRRLEDFCEVFHVTK